MVTWWFRSPQPVEPKIVPAANLEMGCGAASRRARGDFHFSQRFPLLQGLTQSIGAHLIATVLESQNMEKKWKSGKKMEIQPGMKGVEGWDGWPSQRHGILGRRSGAGVWAEGCVEGRMGLLSTDPSEVWMLD